MIEVERVGLSRAESVKWGVGCTCRLPTAGVATVPGAPVADIDMDNREPRSKYKGCYKRGVLRVACCVFYLSAFSAHDNGRGRAAYHRRSRRCCRYGCRYSSRN